MCKSYLFPNLSFTIVGLQYLSYVRMVKKKHINFLCFILVKQSKVCSSLVFPVCFEDSQL
uniref:Uncharacterized protein n=1 Tax=Rhizophora mucronata TaxID=61149 RepID=A0A2P2KPM6_RHIMU